MKLELRPKQAEVLNELRRNWKTSRTHLVSANVGFGKTVIAAAITNGFFQRGLRVLFVAPYTTLVEQTAKRFMEYGLPQPSIIWQQHPWHDPYNHIQIASADTLIRRDMPKVDVMIVDECFVADTMISTSTGAKRIADLKENDLVKCMNEKTGEVTVDKPLKVFENGTRQITHIKTNKGVVRCTSTHLFYTGESWVQAKDLTPHHTIRFLSSQDSVLIKLRRAVAGVARRIIQSL